ncbi:hypothetical protein ABFS82_08G070600 [Erythranthe guttata]|nr:PREDICTED: uncharacterized protein LOC105976042 [Erythranthe guttata]|eukprot:XP_012856780.1 PREDICTED: uncharacterized protein LOC105976042 [Erythranthe guttata]
MAMEIEVLPDSPNVAMSPARISFSHDLSRNDAVVVPAAAEHHTRSTNSATEFDFCVFRESFEQEYSSSSADELFFDGKILPIEIKKKLPPPSPIRAAPPPPPPEIEEEKQNNNKTSSFWGFKRSSSLNCGSDYARKLCPLPLLSRSNSTGSTPIAGGGGGGAKRSSQVSNNQKQNFAKCSTANSSLKHSSSTNHQKPPLKKSSYGSYSSNGVKFNPVLNVTPANLFGLGLIFSGGKDRSKNR